MEVAIEPLLNNVDVDKAPSDAAVFKEPAAAAAAQQGSKGTIRDCQVPPHILIQPKLPYNIIILNT